jgi:hypothetical protein
MLGQDFSGFRHSRLARDMSRRRVAEPAHQMVSAWWRRENRVEEP